MPYKQGRNPISRKNSPLNARNPFSRVSPLSMKAEDGQSHKELRKADKLKEHKAEMHSKGRDPEQVDAQREEDNTQAANQPMGPERRSSQSPLHSHEEKVKQIEAKIKALKKRYGEADFYERKDVQALFKQKTAAEESHKEGGPSRKSSSPVKAKCPEGWTLNPDKKGKPCLPPEDRKDIPKKGERLAPSRKSSSPLNEDEVESPEKKDKVEAVNEIKKEEKSDGGKVEKIETKEKADTTPKPKSRREKKIDKAEKSGKTRKARRLKGREERKKVRKQRKEGKISRSQKTYAIKESRKNQ
jgi:hypothetical protein